MNAEDFERAADGLAEVVFTMEDVDLNALHDEDAMQFLELKQELHGLVDQYRHDQHATERLQEDDSP